MNHLTYYHIILLFFTSVGKINANCSGELYSNLCDLEERENSTHGCMYVCQRAIYCTVIDISPECNSTAVQLDISDTYLNDLKCELLSLDKKISNSDIELNITESGAVVHIFNDSGKFQIVCSQINNEFDSDQWEVESVSPTELPVESIVELELTVVKMSGYNPNWCLVITPDNDTEILSATWVSQTQVKCLDFHPVIPGQYNIGLTSINLNYDKKISLKVIPKHPIAEKAEYSPDLENIYIYFDVNIEVSSNCRRAFSEESKQNLGVGLTCSTRGNILVVKVGTDSKLITTLEIIENNQICQAGVLDIKYSALPVKLNVSEYTVSGSNFRLYFTNPPCESNGTQKYLNINVVSMENRKRLNFYKIIKVEDSGKRQRKNLIIWKNMRRIQSKVNFQINSTDVLPVFETLAPFENYLEGDNSKMLAAVSVVIRSPPASSAIVAEATVAFCNDSLTLFYYKWLVNDEAVEEDGKILQAENLPPGKYLIKCLIVELNSAEVLGQGWAITELVDWPEKVIIFPTEIVVGTADDVHLRAVTWRGRSVSWTCRTFRDEPCFTTSPNQRMVGDVLDLNSPVISIPAGTLPVGNYIWTVENTNGPNTATVIIKTGDIIVPNVNNSSVFVTSSQEVILNGTITRFQDRCRAWWSALRRKGFDYLDLQPIGMKVAVEEQDIPLVIPPSSDKWIGLQPDSIYAFKLQVFCPVSLAHITVPISVNNPPLLSPLIIEPMTGNALVTNFSIYKLEAKDSPEDYPLSFEWSFIDTCDAEVLIARGASPKKLTTFLPPGDLRVSVRVCDVKKTCSTALSPVISVSHSPDIPPENFNYVRNQIPVLMSNGDTLEAFGLATILFKSLALLVKTKTREEVYATLEDSIKTRIEYLKRKEWSNEKILEFLEQANRVTKYFRKGSDILQYLSDIQNGITSEQRVRRSTSPEVNTTSIFKMYSTILEKNDTIQNRMELLKDVRKYMLKLCGDPLTNSHILDSQVVNISIRKIPEKEEYRTFNPFGESGLNIQLGGKFLKQKVCLCVARFSRDLLGNTKESRITQLLEVQVIRNGKFTKPTKNQSTVLKITFPLSNPSTTGIDCMMWTRNRGWSLKCTFEGSTHDGIVCTCKEFGYFSAFLRYPPVNPIGGSNFGGSVVIPEWDSCIAFKIKEDFVSTVGYNPDAFRDSLKRQLAGQLNIPEEAISNLFIKPGSIQVTVFFVDVHDTKAEAVVKELVNLLHSGNLLLTTPNNTRLTLDRSDLKIMVSPPRHKGHPRMRFIAYAVLGGTILVILVVATGSLILRKRAKRLPTVTSNSSSEDGPVYRRFVNEFSIDGSSASLAVYRRNPLRVE